MALPIIDASFAAAREWLADDDPLVLVSLDVISPEAVELGEPLRAGDALVVASQLAAALAPAKSGRVLAESLGSASEGLLSDRLAALG